MNQCKFAGQTFLSFARLKSIRFGGIAMLMLILHGSAFAQNIYDARVFDWRFYVNAHADLLQAGINNPHAAQLHWARHGINEGRQAHPAFHSRQYLDQYGDLRNAFGATNFRAALNHYLNSGIAEGRRGFIQGTNQYGRWTIRNDHISVSASVRQAAAIDSIFWGGRELINSWDHGRQVQMAVNKFSNPAQAECYNPTEAGSLSDYLKPTTTSLLTYADSSSSWMKTESRPAFWLNPSNCGTEPSTISNYWFGKDVEMSPKGLPLAVTYRMRIHVPESIGTPNILQMQVPAGFVAGDLNTFYRYDPATNSLQTLSGTAGSETDAAVIVSTANGSHAYGAWVSPESFNGSPVRYAYGNGGSQDPAYHYNFVIPVVRLSAVSQGTVLQGRAFISVGSLDNVRVTINQLYNLQKTGQL